MDYVEQVAEAIWRATVPAAVEKGITFDEMAESSHTVFRAMAQAAIDALGLPIVWGFGIPNELGWFDANANTFHTKADAEKAMRQHDKIFPDDRRRLAWHFGSGPWIPVGGGE